MSLVLRKCVIYLSLLRVTLLRHLCHNKNDSCFSTDDFSSHERRTPVASRRELCFKLKMSYHEYATEVITVIFWRAAQKQKTGRVVSITNLEPVLRMNGAVHPLLPYICLAWFFVNALAELDACCHCQCRCRQLLTKTYGRNSLSLHNLP
jgi:hypothetical protein